MTYTNKRSCGTCIECCNGNLSAQIYEYKMTKNTPCHFIDLCNKNCSIYENRPQLCKDYRCAWLDGDDLIPNWMKPEYSKVIITPREVKDNDKSIYFWSVVECYTTMSSEVLNWLFRTCKTSNINLHYKLNGTDYHIGSEEFLNYVKTHNGTLP